MGKPQEYLQTDLETWTKSDRYHNEHLINDDQVLDHVLETSESLPNIAVSKAQIAQDNFKYAGLDDKIQLILGPAKESIESLHPDPPFDLIFIDADKQGNLDYFVQAKRLIRKGGVIIVNAYPDKNFLRVDNVVRYGRVADLNYHDQAVEGVRRLVEFLKTDNTVEATTLSTVGEKGYDGFIYAVKI